MISKCIACSFSLCSYFLYYSIFSLYY